MADRFDLALVLISCVSATAAFWLFFRARGLSQPLSIRQLIKLRARSKVVAVGPSGDSDRRIYARDLPWALDFTVSRETSPDDEDAQHFSLQSPELPQSLSSEEGVVESSEELQIESADLIGDADWELPNPKRDPLEHGAPASERPSGLPDIAASDIPKMVQPCRRELKLACLSPRRLDLVETSVFGPTELAVSGTALIQVFLHQPEIRKMVLGLASEADPDASRRAVQTLEAELAIGQRVEIILDGRGLCVDQETRQLTWRGEPCSCQFTITAPMHSAGRSFQPRVLVLINSVPIGSVTFALKITDGRPVRKAIQLLGERARYYTYAFLSYASPDRAEVIRRAQMLRLMGIDFFSDLLSIEPGEHWMQRLCEEIDRCDVFCLFWSSRAKLSEWVMKEIDHALARGAANDGIPDIVPVIIEGPPPPDPPESLKHLHFNDWMLYVLAGEQRGISAAR